MVKNGGKKIVTGCLEQKIVRFEKSLDQKSLDQKKFGPKKFGAKKFGAKKFGAKKFGAKKSLDQNRALGQRSNLKKPSAARLVPPR